MHKLSGVFTAIVQGDLTKPVTLHSNDQFGQLAQAIEGMRIHLVQVVERLSKEIVLATQISKRISASTLETKQNSQHVVRKMDEINENSRNQSELANTILKLVEDAGQQIEACYAFLKNTLEDAGVANQLVQKGKQGIHRSLQQLGCDGDDRPCRGIDEIVERSRK